MNPKGTASSIGSEVAPLIVGHVCLHAAMAGTRMAAPLLALSQGYSTFATGILVALFAFTQIFLSLPAGRFTDRHGLRRPLTWCAAAAMFGIGIAAVWPIYPVLCVSALLCGGSVGAAIIALQRHVGRAAQTPAQMKQVFSWLSTAPAAANLLGPLVAGLMIDQVGYRAAFLVLAALPLAAWLSARSARESVDERAKTRRAGTSWDMLAEPSMKRLLTMNWFMTAAWDLHGFMVPLLGHERGLQASVIGIILGAFALAAALVRIAMPFVSDRVQEWALITGAVAVAGLLLLAYPFTKSALTMGFVSALMGMALGSVQPMVLSMLHQITPSHRQGEALAIRLILINLSALTVPLMLGMTGGLIGSSGVFWLMGSVVTAGSGLGTRLRRAVARRDE